MKLSDKSTVRIWGGIECTLNRIQNSYSNQLIRSGHYQRPGDIDLIAELGIRTLRYPVLWEAIAPNGLKSADWSWTDERLEKIRSLGIEPIAGLIHHGSGPPSTSLIDPDFAERFTEFAIAVAERYPFLKMFTPVNEPLTTARFSCLYGHWYPHERSNRATARALVNQCKATAMAMQEIKRRIPGAMLIQTEDLGKCYGTEELRYQWEFENERRWASLDLLTGNFSKNLFFEKAVLPFKELQKDVEYLFENVSAPDIIGINHYITSERYLDHNVGKYPEWSHGGNGIDAYADVEIVRADIFRRAGHYTLLKETSERYGLPVALTEVHLGATRDEQLRWFMEAYKAVNRLKSEGVDVRGITVWSMFGAYDWNSLLTRENNYYETGVFDVSSGQPRPTAVANLIHKLNNNEKPEAEVLKAQGWWENPGVVNFMFGTKQEQRQLTPVNDLSEALPAPTPKPILITGATGTLGKAFSRICKIRNISHVLLSRQQLDITDREAIKKVLDHHQPWAVINAAGFVKVDEAEIDPGTCIRENTDGAARLASACMDHGVAYLTFSTDFVFNGDTNSPYREMDETNPLNIYGVSKLLAENRVLNVYPSSLIIRTSSFFGPWDEYNFLAQMMKALSGGDQFQTTNLVMSPTYVPDLVNACLDLIIDKEKGIWHISNPSSVSWTEFARMTAEAAQLKTALIRTVTPESLGYRAARPAFSALASSRGLLMPPLDSAIGRFLEERQKVFEPDMSYA